MYISSIHSLSIPFISQGCGGSWSQTKLNSDDRWGKTWAGCQSTARHDFTPQNSKLYSQCYRNIQANMFVICQTQHKNNPLPSPPWQHPSHTPFSEVNQTWVFFFSLDCVSPGWSAATGWPLKRSPDRSRPGQACPPPNHCFCLQPLIPKPLQGHLSLLRQLLLVQRGEESKKS